MVQGNFYYISDNYFKDFPDEKLMQNKEVFNGKTHDRPCFYAFLDGTTELYWLIPISSQVEKYKKYYNKKIEKYKKCDTIEFGQVLGHEKAFLIQNMCPVTSEYIKNEYTDSKSGTPVRINGVFEKKLISKAKKVLILQKNGAKLIFPDVLEIEKKLLSNNSSL